MKKILLFLFISIFLLSVSITYAYPDVTSNTKYSEAINYITDLGIVSGYPDGTYQPGAVLSRAELLKIVIEARYENEFEVFSNDKCFSDIDTTQWYVPYVCFGKSKGIVQGYPDGTFRPAQAINFIEALKITLVTFGAESGFNYFESDPWYKEGVDQASNLNVIPLDIIAFDQYFNRGQMAELITRILKNDQGELNDYLGNKKDYRVTYETIQAGINVEDQIEGDDYYLGGDQYKNVNLNVLHEDFVYKYDYCEQNYFKAKFILLYMDESDLTQEKIDKVEKLQHDLPLAFAYATGGLAKMDVDSDIAYLKGSFTYDNQDFNSDDTNPAAVTKKFFETNQDEYDFLIISKAFISPPTYSSSSIVIQKVSNIEFGDEIDESELYGSNGNLRSVITLKSLDNLLFDYETNPTTLILHELGHNWGMFIGNNFEPNNLDLNLPIKQQSQHFYNGLISHYPGHTPMGADYWVSNDQGNYRLAFDKIESNVLVKYHPIQLYLMGLLPRTEYNTEYGIVNMGSNRDNTENATLVTTISVNDIISTYNERGCN